MQILHMLNHSRFYPRNAYREEIPYQVFHWNLRGNIHIALAGICTPHIPDVSDYTGTYLISVYLFRHSADG